MLLQGCVWFATGDLVVRANLRLSKGDLVFKVKWEGYEKKADQTWEPEDSLR